MAWWAVDCWAYGYGFAWLELWWGDVALEFRHCHLPDRVWNLDVSGVYLLREEGSEVSDYADGPLQAEVKRCDLGGWLHARFCMSLPSTAARLYTDSLHRP